MDFNKYLKGEINLPPKDFFCLGNAFEVSKVNISAADTLIGRLCTSEEAERWVDYMKAIKSDFQVLNHLRDVFILRANGNILGAWTDYLFEGNRSKFLFRHLKEIATRLKHFGISKEDLKRILNT